MPHLHLARLVRTGHGELDGRAGRVAILLLHVAHVGYLYLDQLQDLVTVALIRRAVSARAEHLDSGTHGPVKCAISRVHVTLVIALRQVHARHSILLFETVMGVVQVVGRLLVNVGLRRLLPGRAERWTGRSRHVREHLLQILLACDAFG